MLFFKNKKQEEGDSKHELGFEERERKTPFAGYVLLIAMTIISLMFGFSMLDDLEDIPQKPEALSSCAIPFISYGWQDTWRYSGPYYDYQRTQAILPGESILGSIKTNSVCSLSILEKEHGIEAAFAQSKEVRDQLKILETKLSQNRQSLFQIQRNITQLQNQYGIGLQERGVQIPQPIYNVQELNTQLGPLEEKYTAQNIEITGIENNIKNLNTQLKPHNEKIVVLYKAVLSDWRVQWRWYELWVFLLQMLFVFPFFWFILKWYFSLAAKNSPYTIIATFALITASIFVVVIVSVYFWALFLGLILETLWVFIQKFQILKSLINYVGMLASIALFGGAVYLLQKKIFNPKRVAMRRLREYQCPICQFSLKLAKGYCPHCGEHISEKCSVCGNQRYLALSACPHCGDKKQL